MKWYKCNYWGQWKSVTTTCEKLYMDSQYDWFLKLYTYVFVCKLLVYNLFRRFKGKYQMTEYTHLVLWLFFVEEIYTGYNGDVFSF